MNADNQGQHAARVSNFSWSRLKRTVRLGVKSIWLHRLRSMLTVLGIVFGVCSVISMLAVGEGASANVQDQIKRLGSNNIIIESKKPSEEQKDTTTSRSRALQYGLTYADVQTIRETLPSVEIIVPARIIRDYVWYRDRNVDTEIYGTVPWYPSMRNHEVKYGRYFNEIEMEGRANVCVIGLEMAERLFPIENPIGKSVKVARDYYRVIGVMEPLGSEGAGETSSGARAARYRMYIPLTAARHRFSETLVKRSSGSFEAETVELHAATVKVQRQEDVVETGRIINDMLANRHKKKDYTMTIPLELLRNAEETKRVFNIVLGAIAGISLLVGGIGIMNIMLASVTERTREIGIRRALGAKRKDIVTQFLVETVILSGSGGIIGVALGLIIPFFITLFSDMPTQVTFWSPFLAFSISALVGIVFGLYPALRAADMDPVEALRHE